MSSYWYAGMIGQEFLVTFNMEGTRYVVVDQYSKEIFVPHIKYIDVRDTEVVQHVKYTEYFSREIVFD
jgi:hypothetical protein